MLLNQLLEMKKSEEVVLNVGRKPTLKDEKPIGIPSYKKEAFTLVHWPTNLLLDNKVNRFKVSKIFGDNSEIYSSSLIESHIIYKFRLLSLCAVNGNGKLNKNLYFKILLSTFYVFDRSKTEINDPSLIWNYKISSAE